MKLVLRIFGSLCLVAAVLFAVVDATRSVAASALVVTPFWDSWAATAPESLAGFEARSVATLGREAWLGIVRPVFSLPGFALFGLLAFVFFALGRRPAPQPGWGRDGRAVLRRRRV